jgi:hypothetical protein
MARIYSRTAVRWHHAMLLISRSAGVLANHKTRCSIMRRWRQRGAGDSSLQPATVNRLRFGRVSAQISRFSELVSTYDGLKWFDDSWFVDKSERYLLYHLRHAKFAGSREDKDPRKVIQEHAGEGYHARDPVAAYHRTRQTAHVSTVT